MDTRSDSTGTKPERLLGRLAAEYEYAIVEEILGQGLHGHLDGLQSKLNQVGAAIHETFFATRPDPVPEPVVEATQVSTQIAAAQ
jgi:uncharacterized alpha-E superfamily protein